MLIFLLYVFFSSLFSLPSLSLSQYCLLSPARLLFSSFFYQLISALISILIPIPFFLFFLFGSLTSVGSVFLFLPLSLLLLTLSALFFVFALSF